MTHLKNILATLAVMLAINPVAKRIIENNDPSKDLEKAKQETIHIKEKPAKGDKAPVCENGGGGTIG